MKDKMHGFTLMELLIVVALIGILAKIAIPSYLEHMQKARRSQAEAALVSLANAMEMYKMQHAGKYSTTDTAHTPTGTDPTAAGILSNQVPVTGVSGGDDKIYTLEITSISSSTYTLTATPVTAKPDARCGSLTYTQAGVKAASTGATDCW